MHKTTPAKMPHEYSQITCNGQALPEAIPKLCPIVFCYQSLPKMANKNKEIVKMSSNSTGPNSSATVMINSPVIVLLISIA